MEAEVHQTLAYVERPHGAAFDLALADELVHADSIERYLEDLAQSHAQVVRIENRMSCAVAKATRSKQTDVSVGPREHPEIAVEGGHAADRSLGNA